MQYLQQPLQKLLGLIGLRLARVRPETLLPVEFSKEETEIFEYVRANNLTMASNERMYSTMLACKHVINRNIEGDFVECGVWRGGNAMLAAAIFNMHKVDKKIYLFDTFAGMTEPTEIDTRTQDGMKAMKKFRDNQRDGFNDWAYSSIEDVRDNFQKAGLLSNNIVMVKGDVLCTLENIDHLPLKISVLRLDTDWYESTKRELEVLYPLLCVGGVIIIDDYGHWAGSKIATDEYFEKYGGKPFLQYIDGTGRAGVKCN